MTDTIRVVAGVIVQVDAFRPRVLLTQRTGDRDFPYRWESPGGKVEPGDENPRDALSRELEEEVGLRARIALAPFLGTLFGQEIHTSPGGRGSGPDVLVSFYIVRPSPRWRPDLREVAGAGWFSLTDMLKMRDTLIPGNARLVNFLFGNHLALDHASNAENKLIEHYNNSFRTDRHDPFRRQT